MGPELRGTNGEDGGREWEAGRVAGPGGRVEMGELEQGQRSEAEGRAQRYGVRGSRTPGVRGDSGSEGETPGARSGRGGARQVRGRSHVRAEPSGEEPGGGGADAGPAGGVRRSSSARAAGAAELELEPEPGPGRESGPGPGRSGLQRYGVGRL